MIYSLVDEKITRFSSAVCLYNPYKRFRKPQWKHRWLWNLKEFWCSLMILSVGEITDQSDFMLYILHSHTDELNCVIFFFKRIESSIISKHILKRVWECFSRRITAPAPTPLMNFTRWKVSKTSGHKLLSSGNFTKKFAVFSQKRQVCLSRFDT